MGKRTAVASVLPVWFCLLASIPLGWAGWLASLVLTMALCRDLYGDEFVAIFGNRHWGVFANVAPWVPVAIAALGFAAPWFVWHAIETRRVEKREKASAGSN